MRWWRLICSTLAFAFALSSAEPSAANASHYTLAEGVELGPQMEVTLGRIAAAFHQRTGRTLYVTSGTRSPESQAEAMFDKLARGQSLLSLYRDQEAASEIQQAYQRARRRGRARAVRAMTGVIRAQMARDCYISRHLRASAVDIRSRDMSRRERRIFEEVVQGFSEVSLLAEGTPPHFHIQLR